HGLGAMAVATRVFDALAPKLELAPADRDRFRETLRLAVLFHDLGHAPLSHATERIMPRASELRVPEWTQSEARRAPGRQADHEDYTLKLVLDSALAADLKRHGVEPSHVASLLCGRPPPGGNPFRSGSRDLLPILRQIVSGELDADRMDYLQHDDVTLIAALRASQNPWAKRIVRRNGYRLLVELGPALDEGAPAQLEQQRARLEAEGIDAFTTMSRGILSTYGREATLYVRS